jgi:hypothetical protein
VLCCDVVLWFSLLGKRARVLIVAVVVAVAVVVMVAVMVA